jgi:hypothetical protein
VPRVLSALVERAARSAQETGNGFYLETKNPDGSLRILALDPKTLAYRELAAVTLPSIGAAGAIDDAGVRIRRLFLADDAVGALLRRTIGPH